MWINFGRIYSEEKYEDNASPLSGPPPVFSENPQASPRGLRWYIPSSFLPASECRHHSVSRREALIMTKPPLWSSVVVSSLCTLTAVANGVVIFIIIRRPRLHNTGNCFVLSLAVADFCVGLSLALWSLLCDVDDTKCDVIHFQITHFFLTASVTNLCSMVADRYISVVKSLRYNELSRDFQASCRCYFCSVAGSRSCDRNWKCCTHFERERALLLACLHVGLRTVVHYLPVRVPDLRYRPHDSHRSETFSTDNQPWSSAEF